MTPKNLFILVTHEPLITLGKKLKKPANSLFEWSNYLIYTFRQNELNEKTEQEGYKGMSEFKDVFFHSKFSF